MKETLDLIKKISNEELRKSQKIFLDDYPISSTDTMMPKQPWSENAQNSYFAAAKSAINLIDATLQLTYTDKSDIKTILDFPCGHGRVLRGLRSHFNESQIYACDLDHVGVDFCSENFRAVGVYSDENPAKITFDTKFDLIWCGSLFTHLNHNKWPAFFHFFNRVLRKKKGILIFTYAGSYVKDLIEAGEPVLGKVLLKDDILLEGYNQDGFGFKPSNPKQSKFYGRAICSPEWIRKFLDNELPGYRTVLHFERGWNGRQDVIAIVKES